MLLCLNGTIHHHSLPDPPCLVTCKARSSESLVLSDSLLVQRLRARAAALVGLGLQHAEPPQLVPCCRGASVEANTDSCCGYLSSQVRYSPGQSDPQ